MTKGFAIAALVGIVLAIALVAYQGFATVGAAFASVGWGLALVVAIRIAQVVGAGLSWWLLIPDFPRFRLAEAVGLRFIREGINTLLPVAQVGGDLIGARLATFYGVDGASAGASVLVDLLTQTATQVLFSLAGLGLLAALGGNEALVFWVAIGLAVMAAAVIGFFFFQRLGGFHLVERGLMRLAESPQWRALSGVANLHGRLQAIHEDMRGVTGSFLVHLVTWFIGALEVWVALTFMGYDIDFGDAVVIESLGHAVRAAGFLVPGALGIQEGGFIALCAVYGIPPASAIAVSLVKRVPEIVLGVPSLMAWHAMEARRRSASSTAPGMGGTSPP